MICPTGSKEIIAARKKGLKPADMLIISIIGILNEQNPVVYANPEAEYDWRWIRGLDACLFFNQHSKVKPMLEQILSSCPASMLIYNVDTFAGGQVWRLPRVEDIDKPKNAWRWVIDVLPWMKCDNEDFQQCI